jgi:hypothetical protein
MVAVSIPAVVTSTDRPESVIAINRKGVDVSARRSTARSRGIMNRKLSSGFIAIAIALASSTVKANDFSLCLQRGKSALEDANNYSLDYRILNREIQAQMELAINDLNNDLHPAVLLPFGGIEKSSYTLMMLAGELQVYIDLKERLRESDLRFFKTTIETHFAIYIIQLDTIMNGILRALPMIKREQTRSAFRQMLLLSQQMKNKYLPCAAKTK